MRAINAKHLLAIYLVTLLLVFLTASCGPPQQSGGDGPSASGPNGIPEITDETIQERINDTRVYEVPPENGVGDPIVWNFDEDEPKEISVVEKTVDGTRATLVLDIKTRSADYVRNPRQVEGRMRTSWVLRTGWVLRRWEIVETENISMKYRNTVSPPKQNSEPETP